MDSVTKIEKREENRTDLKYEIENSGYKIGKI
jgi:hypothetical protein